MNNLYLYNKYIIKPQILLKFPKKNFDIKNIYNIRKIKVYLYLIDLIKNYYIYLYNICILMRIIFNKKLYIKKIHKYYGLNKIYMQLALEHYNMFLFIDVFKEFLLNSFQIYNMGLNYKNFDIFGNYIFEFNYCDPIFTTRNTVIIWSPNNKIKIIIYFFNKNKELNKLYMRFLGLKYYYLKKLKKKNI